MLVELIMVALVVVYVGVVVLGHVLLIAAIYKCLCEDHVGAADVRAKPATRRRRATTRNRCRCDNPTQRW